MIVFAYECLRREFEALLARQPASNATPAAEDVHQMRIATRRLRIALRLFRRMLPNEAKQFRKDFGSFARALGDVRDLDVYSENFRAYAQGRPAREHRRARRLRAAPAQGAHGGAQQLDARLFADERHAALLRSFAALLDGAPSPAAVRRWRSFKVADGVDKYLKKSLKRVLKLGNKIGEEARAKELHRLRIRTKRFRYELEFFVAVYPSLGKAAKATKALQDLLGVHQDACTATERLEAYARSLRKRGARRERDARGARRARRGPASGKPASVRAEVRRRSGARSSAPSRAASSRPESPHPRAPSRRRSTVLRLVLVLAFAALAPFQAMAQNRLERSAEIDAYLEPRDRDDEDPRNGRDGRGRRRHSLSAARSAAADAANDKPMAVDSIFRLASMTKPVTSAAVMMLVEEGDVGLDDPISQYLPAFEHPEVIVTFNAQDKTFTKRPATTEITVRHLLTHTSGLGLLVLEPDPRGADRRRSDRERDGVPAAARSRHEVDLRRKHARARQARRRRFRASRSIDSSTERIFVPLGMSDTFYVVPAAKHDRVVTTFRTTDKGLVESPNPEQISAPIFGDGGLHSTAADYVKFMQMFLNDGRAPDGKRLLSEESVKLMGRTQTGNVKVELQPTANEAVSMPFPLGAGRDTFGLGFQITGAHNDPGARSPGSMSWAGIFNTEFWIDPERGISAVLLMQYLPFYDAAAIETLQGFEQRVYESLAN